MSTHSVQNLDGPKLHPSIFDLQGNFGKTLKTFAILFAKVIKLFFKLNKLLLINKTKL